MAPADGVDCDPRASDSTADDQHVESGRLELPDSCRAVKAGAGGGTGKRHEAHVRDGAARQPGWGPKVSSLNLSARVAN